METEMQNKNILKDNRGSALIMTVIVLVSAVMISMAITAISVMESKLGGKVKSSTPALQVADSGLEWAIKKIGEASPEATIEEVFESFEGETGTVDCGEGIGLESSDKKGCELFFLSGAESAPGSGQIAYRVITEGNLPIGQIFSVRAVGKVGDAEKKEEVTRALEAMAAPNCPSGSAIVGDFCIERETGGSGGDWKDAAESCSSSGGRLCSAAELWAASQLAGSGVSISDDGEWTDSIADGSSAITIDDGGTTALVSMDDSVEYHCCRNR